MLHRRGFAHKNYLLRRLNGSRAGYPNLRAEVPFFREQSLAASGSITGRGSSASAAEYCKTPAGPRLRQVAGAVIVEAGGMQCGPQKNVGHVAEGDDLLFRLYEAFADLPPALASVEAIALPDECVGHDGDQGAAIFFLL